MDGPVGDEGRDPAAIETEVARLRDDCTAIVRELEGRWERAVRVPRAVGVRARRLERSVAALVRAHPGLTAFVLALGGALFLARDPLRALLRRWTRRRRRLFA